MSSGPKKFRYQRIKSSCADCVFFQNQNTYDKPCKQLGILSTQKPCPRFTINPYSIDFQVSKAPTLVKELLTNLELRELHKFTALLNQEARTRSFGFQFGQEVMVRIFPGEYISNYASAKVINANKNHVYIQGANGFRGMMFHGSVISMKQWSRKRKTLVSKNLIKDPNYNSYTHVQLDTRNLRKDDYQPMNVGNHKLKKKPVRKGRTLVVK